MFKQELKVHYRDGTCVDVTATQWALGQYIQWAQGQKIPVNDPQNMGLQALVMTRYQAYAELHRDSKTVPQFKVWDATVDEVETVGVEDVDPTQLGTSGG